MRFTPNEDFTHGRITFEENNTYNSEKYDLSDEEVMAFYNAGWIEVEGLDPAPPRNPGVVELIVENITHG